MTSTSNQPLAAVILAAGMGKRMKSDLPKVMHQVGGKPMILHVIDQAKSSGADQVVVIVGHGRDLVIPLLNAAGARHVVQEQQLGTGHAVRMASEALAGFEGNVLVLSGDVPLLSSETIQQVLECHRQQKATATVVTAVAPDPSGYGRVIRGEKGLLSAIREHKDCTSAELEIREINSGIYVFRAKALFEALGRLKNDNAQGEYYLTDVFADFFAEGEPVAAFAGDFDEITGVNTPKDLAKVEEIWQSRQAQP